MSNKLYNISAIISGLYITFTCTCFLKCRIITNQCLRHINEVKFTYNANIKTYDDTHMHINMYINMYIYLSFYIYIYIHIYTNV